MSTLSQLAESLIGSEIVKLGNEINNRIGLGEEIYNYTIGDFNPALFPIPDALEAAIHAAYQNRYTNYPPAEGLAELREAVSEFILQQQGLSYESSEILIASGGRPLIYSLFKTLVDKGDKVIYAVPSWNNNHYVHMNDGLHCVIEALPENNFMPSTADIADHIQGATMICLCTPQNPTGTTLDEDTLAGICDLILEENQSRGEQERKVFLMFDQMYGLLTYGGIRHFNPVSLRPAMKDYTIFIDGISKSFAATGVRVGWSMGPAHVIQKMKALLSHIGAWAPMAEQKATAVFLLSQEPVRLFLDQFKAALEQRLNLIYHGLMELKAMGFPVDAIAPQAAIYLTIKIDIAGKMANDRLLETQTEVTEYILNAAKIAVVPFYAFGASRQSPWYRLSVGTCVLEDIPVMLAQLEAALQVLR